MSTTTDSLPNYRRATERWPQASALVQYYGAITHCIAGNGHGVVEHVKSFIECVCITILGEFGEPLPSADPTSTELLVAALKPLGFQNSRGASKLDKVLSAFNRLSDALSEMRNESGPVAHGKDGFLDAIEEDHARSFLHTGEPSAERDSFDEVVLVDRLNEVIRRLHLASFLLNSHLKHRMQRRVQCGEWPVLDFDTMNISDSMTENAKQRDMVLPNLLIDELSESEIRKGSAV